MTYDDYCVCEAQGRLYRYVAIQGVDMAWFSENYLHSDFCRRAFDTIYSRFQTADEEECLDFIRPEIGEYKFLNNGEMFSPDVAQWIGHTYRQLYIETGIPSSELVDGVPFDVMCRYYPGLHTVDEEMATDIICENFKLNKAKER